MVVNGDITQIDLPQPKKSGLRQALHVLKGVEGIRVLHFEQGDAVRHPLVQKVVAAYEVHERRLEADAASSGREKARSKPLEARSESAAGVE